MRKTSLVVVALCATALLWCLDRATSSADADVRCNCSPITIHATIGDDGYAVVDLPQESLVQDNKFPLIQTYSIDSSGPTIGWEPVSFRLERNRVVIYGEPGTAIFVVINS